jgi:hypothetical protein
MISSHVHERICKGLGIARLWRARRGAALVGLALSGSTGCGGGARGVGGLVMLPVDVARTTSALVRAGRDQHSPRPPAEPETDAGPFTCPSAMKAAPRQPAAPAPPDAAVVVFLRPSDSKDDIDVLVVEDDEHGGGPARFLGQSRASSSFEVTLPPGEHRFLAWAYDAAALRATLAPGKRYYVEVALDFGWTSHTRLSAVTPSRKTWKKLPTWLAEAHPLVLDEPRGQACLTRGSNRADDLSRRARAALAQYDASDLAERTLRAEDGE